MIDRRPWLILNMTRGYRCYDLYSSEHHGNLSLPFMDGEWKNCKEAIKELATKEPPEELDYDPYIDLREPDFTHGAIFKTKNGKWWASLEDGQTFEVIPPKSF